MDIEGYAVAKVLESLAITEHLVGYISLRDKEPVWDGFVYIYTDRVNHKKENLKGRVPVQIKGQLTTKKKTSLFKRCVTPLCVTRNISANIRTWIWMHS